MYKVPHMRVDIVMNSPARCGQDALLENLKSSSVLLFTTTSSHQFSNLDEINVGIYAQRLILTSKLLEAVNQSLQKASMRCRQANATPTREKETTTSEGPDDSSLAVCASDTDQTTDGLAIFEPEAIGLPAVFAQLMHLGTTVLLSDRDLPAPGGLIPGPALV
ncbi:unnamed protein product, partial [Protopolystoma xenopodis]